MFDGAFDVGWRATGCGEKICNDFLSSQSGEGKRGNELLRTTGHDDLNVELFLLQAADEFRGLIRCDASGDPKRDSHSNSAANLLFSPALFALCGAYFQVRSFVLEVTPLQFFFGDSILVSPVTDENATSVSIYLPQDRFYDFATFAPVDGTGQYVTLSNVSFTEIESDKGHDSFLLEVPGFDAAIKGFMEGSASLYGID